MKKENKIKTQNIARKGIIIQILSVLICINLVSSVSSANSIGNELSNVWKSLGGESSINNPNYYQGQQAGHYTMGSMYFARPKKNRPLISVNYPEIDFDKSCYSQGVLNFGGVSFISGNELKEKMTSIVQQAGMMFVYLGISSISPVIGETLQEVYSKLQELGGFLSDECQAAKQIASFAGDTFSQNSEKAKGVFAKMKLGKGDNDDLSKVYKNFPAGKAAALEEAAQKDERFVIENINLAWKAMEKLKISNPEIKELMMTISGTIIINSGKNDQSPPNVQYISSNVTNPSTLGALLKGKQNLKVITCINNKDNKCLQVEGKDITIAEEKSFERRVLDFFDEIKTALKEDEELKQEAQNFLLNSGIPAYSIYDKLYQYTNGNPEYEQGVLAEIVAWNILYNYLHDILKEVNEAANNLQVMASGELKDFKESIRHAQKLLSEHEMKDISRYKLQLFMVKRSETMEDAMANDIAQILNMTKASY